LIERIDDDEGIRRNLGWGDEGLKVLGLSIKV